MTVLLNHIRKKAEADHNKNSVSAVLNRKTVDFEAEFGVPNLPPEFSAEVQAVFDRMPNELTSAEKTAIENFVDASVASGNWDEYDYFWFFALSDPDNALTDWKTGKIATNVNGAGHTAGQGFDFNGSTQYINTEVILQNDAVNYNTNNSNAAIYIYQNDDTSNQRWAFGEFGVSDLGALQQPSNDRILTRASRNEYLSVNGEPFFENNTRYELVNDSELSNNYVVYKNGSNLVDISGDSDGLGDLEIYVGGLNIDGSLAGGSFLGTQSYFLLGGDFNQSALNNELTQLENDLIQ